MEDRKSQVGSTEQFVLSPSILNPLLPKGLRAKFADFPSRALAFSKFFLMMTLPARNSGNVGPAI